MCSSYPQLLLVPAWITDTELDNVGTFRSWKRIPAVVYRSVSLISRFEQNLTPSSRRVEGFVSVKMLLDTITANQKSVWRRSVTTHQRTNAKT